MLQNTTVDKLIEMRLTAMADLFKIQWQDPSMKELSFEDRFGLLVDAEYNRRKDNRLKRLIKQAGFEQPDATIADIDYHSGRKLDQSFILRLATCEYITEYRNIFITGATGSGKTYLACALGMAACMRYYKTMYVRLPDLLMDLQAAPDAAALKTVMKKYINPTLLIIDEWLLIPPSEDEVRLIFEVIHKRRKKSSTIFCSQFQDDGWYERLGGGDNPISDAIMDRIQYDAYRITIIPSDPANDRSMREIYGIKSTDGK
jgi:DNA replication protein DnaC